MALLDYPPDVIAWASPFPREMLQAIGDLAVISAEVEQLLHRIYWKHAGLNDATGPVVTDNLNPKRLSEDILKFVRMDPLKINIADDLALLLKEFETLNTQRNQCLHWIWEESAAPAPVISRGIVPPHLQRRFKLKKPIYKQANSPDAEFTPAGVINLGYQFSWLRTRLNSHAMEVSELLKMRGWAENEFTNDLPKSGGYFAEIFFPAPWLGKPLPQASTPQHPHEKHKQRPHRRGSSRE